MTASAWAWSIFCLRLSTGASALLFSEYLALSPRWFRGVIAAAGLGVLLRYWLLVWTAITPVPLTAWMIDGIDLWAAIGLTLPCAAALDQLVRHPAMTPKKLLRAYAPIAVAWMPAVVLGPLASAVVQSAFALLIVWVGARLIRKLPVRKIRLSVAGLALAQLLLAGQRLAGSGVMLDIRVLLVSEGVVLGSIWASLRAARTSSA